MIKKTLIEEVKYIIKLMGDLNSIFYGELLTPKGRGLLAKLN